MCQGRHLLISTNLGIIYCLIGIFSFFLGCTQQQSEPFLPLQENELEPEINQINEEVQEMPISNQSPIIFSDPLTSINIDQPYLYPASAIDFDEDSLIWKLGDTVSGLTIDKNTGVVYGADLTPGSHNITIMVEDDRGGSSEQFYTLVVTQNPIIHSSGPEYTFTGYSYRYSVLATSPDGTDLIYALENGPSGMRIDTDSGNLEWENPVVGEYEVVISVSSTSGNSATEEYSLNVLDENTLKIISRPETIAYESQQYRYRPSVLGLSESEKTFLLSKAVPGMEIEPSSGLISWVPESSGLYQVEISVVDVDGRSGSQLYDVQVRSMEEMDQLFNKIIQDVFDNLSSGNLDVALTYLSAEAQANYLPVFNALLPHMEEIISNMGNMERISINNISAEYIVPRTLGGETRMFIVTFVSSENGVWQLHSL